MNKLSKLKRRRPNQTSLARRREIACKFWVNQRKVKGGGTKKGRNVRGKGKDRVHTQKNLKETVKSIEAAKTDNSAGW